MTAEDLSPPGSELLVAAFRERAAVAIDGAQARELAARLLAMVARAAARWPALALAPKVFCGHLAECVGPQSDLSAALAAIHAEDLYLACACTYGVPRAIAAFEATFAEEIAHGLARVRSPGLSTDDVLQSVREKLFTAAAGQRPKIAEYRGFGELRSWVRIIVLRTHLNMDRTRRRRDTIPAAPDDLLALPDHAVEPEFDYLKTKYRAAFNDSFRHALSTLDARDRNLLRRSFVDRLSIDELGTIHGVHRATAARWLARARGRLLDATREALGVRLRVGGGELDSIMRLLESQLDVSVQRLLASNPGT